MIRAMRQHAVVTRFGALGLLLLPVIASAAPRTRLSLHDGWTFHQAGRAERYPAAVPGSVHLDLLKNGVIGDPFYRDNEKAQQWIGKTDWEYALEFAVPRELLGRRHLELVFDGLDTYATVFLNGREVLKADNMYRRWRVPVTGRLQPTGNTLRVAFRSPINEVLPRMAAIGYELPAVNDLAEKTSPYTRKAPYHFGWDWGPRFVTCGVWKPVRLEAWDDARLVDVVVRQDELSDERARLTAEVEVLPAKPGPASAAEATLAVEVDGAPAATLAIRLGEGPATYKVDFEIPRPKRWWPNGLGEQPLYRVTTRLLVGGRMVDEEPHRVGLRTLELRRVADRFGKSFEFVVNGVPVFAKGANWIPADSFPTRVTRERYAQLLDSARDAHMNMLRVWGGGLYEHDDFYDLADERGLLVWQDFHFSCSLYPADRAFLDNVKVEAEEAVRRLRNHASIALWNGNNEIEAAWFQWGWKERLPAWLWDDYRKIFHELLPEVCARLDPTRAYWPSSPSANLEAPPGSAENGDMHFWAVWHAGEPFKNYEAQLPRFMSEYGFQSFPEMKTIATFATDADLALESPVMLAHQKNARGNQLIREYMLRDYPPPRDFASFLYLSQVLQAEGIKVGAEHLRRQRPRTMGSLYWQLDDCWPVASWSSVDYYGRWKALHRYARRFYADLLVSTDEADGTVGVWVVSDRTSPTPGRLVARLLDFSGAVLWEKRDEVAVSPLASEKRLVVPLSELLAGRDPRRVFLHCELVVDGQAVSTNRRFFAPMKELALARPNLEAVVRAAEGGFVVSLATDTLAPAVHLSYDADDGTFGDDYFDVRPGTPVEVRFRAQGPVELDAFRQGLRVVSLTDAFAPPKP
jgi:beta-mannosidase